ncbi:YihY/virulence factor BrkB family protein [Anaerococcus sp. AGMB00486]|uniref:YihY/virulence factor BrkB family protein n=2 Tax=Anaerococcus TaxID=165779 RepID=A0ABX2N9E9_9FIRM|nr:MULTISPECIES: YihY/virulence factor BrkB family protein [Anaerococcus]MSS78471.1 YihY/virulence factor BrkB family protein [Anaerococcus porci]NVF11327.1 YihY/virulence factor BrkB family protein [Anaerococcus faecalis]
MRDIFKDFSKDKVKHFVLTLIERVREHDLMTLASSLSYYFLSASIPMLLVLLNILTKYMKGNEDVILEFIALMPESIRAIITMIVDSILNSSSITTISTITLLFALWSASKGVSKILIAINVAYGLEDDHSMIKNKIFGFFYTFILIFIVFFLFLLKIYADSLLRLVENILRLINSDFSLSEFSVLINLFSAIIPPLTLILSLTFLYKSAPFNDSIKIGFKDALIGSVSATIMVSVASFAYSFFLQNMSNMSVIYGTLAGIIALLAWMLLFSLTLILGAEIIATYMKVSNSKKRLKQ